MAYELDYIPVGEGEKSGDCIAFRFWDPQIGISSQKVVIIDGGFKESAENLITHINTYYGTNEVDIVISTHPDMDHTSGLITVLEKMKVANLVMHCPWNHVADIRRQFSNGRITVSGVKKDLEESLAYASELAEIAKKKNINIHEPFAGTTAFDGILHFLGPTQEYYQSLLPHFKGTPEPVTSLGVLGMLQKTGETISQKVQDYFHINHLDDKDSTSPENNTSTIILIQVDGHKLLLTGDAGKRAIENAINYAYSQGITLNDLMLFDVPHHGSKRNLGKTMMDHIHAQYAYISAPRDSDKHPSTKVTNHLIKKGIKTFVTQGRHIYHFHGAPIRSGWSSLTEIQFQPVIEL